MKPIALLALVLLVGGAVLGSVLASHTPSETPSYASFKDLPFGGVQLVEAQPFVLDQPYEHEWRKEQPLVRAGYMLVLAVPRDLARPRDTYEPVLYVGEQTAERCNFPMDGEYMVVVVPAPLDAHEHVALDPERTPIWFGGLELPERVDANRIAAELADARAHGIGVVAKGPQAKLRTQATDTIHVRRREDLNPYLADWIERYSPDETDLVARLRRF